MKIVQQIVAVAALAASGWAAADIAAVNGRVVDVSGVAIASAVISSGGNSVTANADGSFQLVIAEPGHYRIDVDAEGYFGMVHTFSVPASTASDMRLPDVGLVQRGPGRRLFLFAGDAMLSRRYFEPRANEPAIVRRSHVVEDGKALLQHVRPYVERADVASVNLETQLANDSPGEALPKSVTFYSPTALPGLLKWAGFDYVALGNNHTFDYRDAGLRSLLDAVGTADIDYSGAGFDEQQARKPFIMALADKDIAFLSYVGWEGTFSPTQSATATKGGAALGNSEVFAEDLASIDEDAISVLQYHSGLEYSAHPAMTEQTRLRTAIDAGADLAIGHHAHVLQGFEIYKDRLIAYSMGNFLFDQFHYTTQLGMLMYVWLDGETFYRAEIVPLNINGYVPTPATGRFRDAVLNRLARLSAPRGVCMTESGAHGVVAANNCSEPQRIDVSPELAGAPPIAISTLGQSPTRPLHVETQGTRYRLGIDMLPRGDFESFGLFGTHDRTWIQNDFIAFPDDDSRYMRIDVPRGESVRAGMKVFERVFTLSNPATLSGRVRVEGSATLRFSLQRRRADDGFEQALEDGPLSEIGTVTASDAGWQEFSFDFAHPRISTRSIRLIVDVENLGGVDVKVSLDELTWIEWRTPWMDGGNVSTETLPATHLQTEMADFQD